MENYIKQLPIDKPGWSVKKIHNSLRNALRNERIKLLKQANPALSDIEVIEKVNDWFEKKFPKESALAKWMGKNGVRVKAKKRRDHPLVEDKPWSLGSCKPPYNIPDHMFPILLEYNRKYQQLSNQPFFDGPDLDARIFPWHRYDRPPAMLTIRKAAWMSRVFPMLSRFQKDDGPDNFKLISLLSLIADIYVDYEIKNDLSSLKAFDSSEIDRIIFGENYNLMNFDLASFEAQIRDSMDYSEIEITPDLTDIFDQTIGEQMDEQRRNPRGW